MDTFFVPQTLMSAAENDREKIIVLCESNDCLPLYLFSSCCKVEFDKYTCMNEISH